MSLTKSVGSALWAIRNLEKISQVDLGNALSQKQVYLVERGESSLSLSKMEDVCRALGVTPTTLMALSESALLGVSPQQILAEALAQLETFESQGGLELLRDHSKGDLDRAKRQASQAKLAAVTACKSQGMTQAQTASQLGMAKSTVRYFWHRRSSE